MKKMRLLLAIGVFTSIGLVGSGCKPKTAGQKIEDKVEDAGHEMNQGVERAKENVDSKK